MTAIRPGGASFNQVNSAATKQKSLKKAELGQTPPASQPPGAGNGSALDIQRPRLNQLG